MVEATRRHEDVYLGASPRGSLALYNASRAWRRNRPDYRHSGRRQGAGRTDARPPGDPQPVGAIRNVDARRVIFESPRGSGAGRATGRRASAGGRGCAGAGDDPRARRRSSAAAAFVAFSTWELLDRVVMSSWRWSCSPVSGAVGASSHRHCSAELAAGSGAGRAALVSRFTVANRGILPKPWLEVRVHPACPGQSPAESSEVGRRGKVVWEIETICRRRGRTTSAR